MSNETRLRPDEPPGEAPRLAFTFSEPKTDDEFDVYYRLRYERLRKPLGLPPGAERDDPAEPSSVHRVVTVNGQIVAAACWVIGMRRDGPKRGVYVRFRQMAVDPAWEGRGIGSAIMRHVEDASRAVRATEIVGNVRLENVPMFRRHGWIEVGEGVKLFDQVESLAMVRPLS